MATLKEVFDDMEELDRKNRALALADSLFGKKITLAPLYDGEIYIDEDGTCKIAKDGKWWTTTSPNGKYMKTKTMEEVWLIEEPRKEKRIVPIMKFMEGNND